ARLLGGCGLGRGGGALIRRAVAARSRLAAQAAGARRQMEVRGAKGGLDRECALELRRGLRAAPERHERKPEIEVGGRPAGILGQELSVAQDRLSVVAGALAGEGVHEPGARDLALCPLPVVAGQIVTGTVAERRVERANRVVVEPQFREGPAEIVPGIRV